MAMGKRKRQQKTIWVSASELPMSPGHPFYLRLNQALEKEGFDAYVERLCRGFYAPVLGRPSLSPGRYFRLLLVGYFEGLDSERGIAWRAADSLAIRSFLGLELNEGAPDHSTISRTRRLIDVETHRQVFTWIQERLIVAGLLVGKTVSIDGTTLEANAAMRSIVRRDTGESYQEFLKRLAKASGIRTPSREALARLDRRRQKKGSNAEWKSPVDPDAKITKLKDGRTHLAHKAEHAVDMETGAIVAVTVQDAVAGDTATLEQTLKQAEEQIEAVIRHTGSWEVEGLQELVADKGYHSTQTLMDLAEQGIRTYVSEPDRGRRKWHDDIEAREVVYANRRRIRGARGQRLRRQRGERVERSFAHLYETGRMRRTHLRGHTNILKRLLLHSGAFNLALLLRTWLGVGTPRGLQGRARALLSLLNRLRLALRVYRELLIGRRGHLLALTPAVQLASAADPKAAFTTGC
jgi:transposase